MNSTLERLTPIDFLPKKKYHSVELHIERYRLIKKIAKPDDFILDIACGIGYGVDIMINNSPDVAKIIGIDIDKESIIYANNNYKNIKTDFVQSSISDFHSEILFDIIVSFETIEHLINPNELLIKILNLLKPNGKIILSFPSSPSLDINKHHFNDIKLEDINLFCDLNNLKIINIQQQKQSFKFKELFSSNLRSDLSIRYLILYYIRNPSYIYKRIKHTIGFGLTNHYTILTIEKVKLF